jgi:hypothetical protein
MKTKEIEKGCDRRAWNRVESRRSGWPLQSNPAGAGQAYIVFGWFLLDLRRAHRPVQCGTPLLLEAAPYRSCA